MLRQLLKLLDWRGIWRVTTPGQGFDLHGRVVGGKDPVEKT
jgi:hypothetical protein